MEISDEDAIHVQNVLLARLDEQHKTEMAELHNKIYFLEKKLHEKNQSFDDLKEINVALQRELNAYRRRENPEPESWNF